MTPSLRSRIEQSFARQSMMATLGATLSEISEARVVITAPLLPGSLQQQGFGHAGLTFSIGDSASGYAGLTTLPDGYEVLTAETKINLLAPAQGDFLRATGTVIKPGKRLIVVSADVHAIKGKKETLIAVMQGTLVPVAV
ncbi:MAG: PaaI family thioesterase [Roseobacter sp.]